MLYLYNHIFKDKQDIS
uniref:Uncharacterized protein n=1 Tax=Rhizophora mucronata TaxID=61149 RepID=A0A2P2QKT7_RHIMU